MLQASNSFRAVLLSQTGGLTVDFRTTRPSTAQHQPH
jgi:hypothetical protein